MRKKELDIPIKALEECGFTVNDFLITQEGVYTIFKLKIEQHLVYTFERSPDSFTRFMFHYTQYTPKFTKQSKTEKWNHLTDVTLNFKKWLNTEVKEYIEELNRPDPVEEARRNLLLSNVGDGDTSKFTKEESKKLTDRIQDFEKLLLEKFEVSKETSSSINQELKYLQEQLGTLNKRDFKAVAQKMFYDVGISVTANVAVDAGRILIGSIHIAPIFWEIVKLTFKLIPVLGHQ